MQRDRFNPAQAQEVAAAFGTHKVDYMFIGKSGAILLGYPGTTQDVDVYPKKDPENGRPIIHALEDLGFNLESVLRDEIVRGNHFVQIKDRPFDIDLVFAPDGIENYEEAKSRMDTSSGFPVVKSATLLRASDRLAVQEMRLNCLCLRPSARSVSVIEINSPRPDTLKPLACLAYYAPVSRPS